MKKFLAALLIVGSLFFVPTAEAAIETFVGEGNATMNKTETQGQLINRAKGYAIRNAGEQVGVYVISQSKLRNLELVEDNVISITGRIMKITDTRVEKTLLKDVLQVRVKITVKLDTDELQRELDKFDKNRPKPAPVEQPKPTMPIERPKPIETPAPSNTIKTYVGTDDYTVGQRETQEEAENHSKLRAMRNACEQAGVFIRSQSRSKDLELVEDEIISVAETIAKIVGKPEYKTEVLSDGRSTVIHTKVTIQINTDDLERRLEEFARRHKR
ncbi:MAG: hypothetical protein IKE46_02535 [Selenomonadaceae bacterium]|nr:hypothetical protein [Selenomonadaceae bacterium]